jgi:CHAP domain-containing protein
MSEWWEEPYRGGGPAKVKGFPRPLYPPDVPEASGYEPSSRGPDVIAYKRTISRLGRWPWQEFDDGYWTDFAHGASNHGVGDSGVAGFQWQQHLDATGWLGQKTFDALRYALVPRELQNGGEQAMDSVAIDLLNEAWLLFEGHPPPPAGGSVRKSALQLAIGELGYAESPAGSNLNKFGKWYGMDGQPWCAMFCTWAYELASDGRSPGFAKGSRYAYVPYIVSDARGNRGGLRTVGDPEPGDLVCYDWDWNGEHDHVGLFEKWIGSREFNAIEGNTSTSSNSNGGQVMRRARSTGGQSTVFVRVEEP